MKKSGSKAGMTRIRLMAAPETVDALAGRIVTLLESTGFEVLEWSLAAPCREPDQDKSRIYLTAIKKGVGDEHADAVIA